MKTKFDKNDSLRHTENELLKLQKELSEKQQIINNKENKLEKLENMLNKKETELDVKNSNLLNLQVDLDKREQKIQQNIMSLNSKKKNVSIGEWQKKLNLSDNPSLGSEIDIADVVLKTKKLEEE